MAGIIVGIDGGGTHTTLAVSNKEGCLLGLVQGGALNFNTIGMEAFRAHLRQALEEVKRQYGPIEALSLGHSALDGEPEPGLAAEMMEGVFDLERCWILSLIHISLRTVESRCAMTNTVRPAIRASIPRCTMASVRVSMELVASSIIMTGGSATAARAIASSCRWPWLRLAPLPLSLIHI